VDVQATRRRVGRTAVNIQHGRTIGGAIDAVDPATRRRGPRAVTRRARPGWIDLTHAGGLQLEVGLPEPGFGRTCEQDAAVWCVHFDPRHVVEPAHALPAV